jgi:hypothetical protein
MSYIVSFLNLCLDHDKQALAPTEFPRSAKESIVAREEMAFGQKTRAVGSIPGCRQSYRTARTRLWIPNSLHNAHARALRLYVTEILEARVCLLEQLLPVVVVAFFGVQEDEHHQIH